MSSFHTCNHSFILTDHATLAVHFHRNPQAFRVKVGEYAFLMYFCAESIFAVCQAVSLAVLLLAAKIQDGRRFIGLLIYLLPGMIKIHS